MRLEGLGQLKKPHYIAANTHTVRSWFIIFLDQLFSSCSALTFLYKIRNEGGEMYEKLLT
jgi:hypothetical protein